MSVYSFKSFYPFAVILLLVALPCSAQTCPPVANVNCAPFFGVGVVSINWDASGAPYTAVDLLRDGVYIADITGQSTYNDSSHSSGQIIYTIVAHCGGDTATTECFVDFSSLFMRGDVNDDGLSNIADAVYLLGHLFLPGSANPINCVDSADANDDSAVNLADAISILQSLFVSPSVPLPQPWGVCGSDPTMDSLGCLSAAACPPPP